MNQITQKEFNFASYLDSTSEMSDPINDLIKKDFFVKENIIGDSYRLDVNNSASTSN